MAKKGLTLCAACSELTPSTGGYCRLCKTPLIQVAPGEGEGHCPACGTLVSLRDSICFGCGWQLKLSLPFVVMITLCMAALSFLFVAGAIGLFTRLRWGIG